MKAAVATELCFFFQAEDGIRDYKVTGVQTCALPICESMDRLQAETQDTCYLTLRSGFDAVCLDRREGLSPIRVLTLDVGSRRPLGVGAAGLAILLRLSDGEAESLIQAAGPRLARYNRMDMDTMRTLLTESREQIGRAHV